MERKTIFITEQQYKEVYETVLREALIVNNDLVKSIVKYLNKHFKPVKYDDINPDGDVIQPYAIQMLSVDGEPLQTISIDNLLGKVDNKFCNKIKDEKDRHRFFKQVIDDWIHGNISREGILSVNVIKEKKTLNQPTYLGEIINLKFRDLLKTPLLENNHHVTYIDEYVDIICEKFKNAFEENTGLDNMIVKLNGDDFAQIPHKFFTDCNIIIKYSYDVNNTYDGGYNYNTVVVDEDERTKNDDSLPINSRVFNEIYFEIKVILKGNSLNKMMEYLSSTFAHEMTHAFQHIRMKMEHNERFTDENYLKSYNTLVKDAASGEDDNVLKGEFASFLYYTDTNERKANIAEFYNEIGGVTEDDIKSKETISKILDKTKLWEIIKVLGSRLHMYNELSDEETKQKLISYYNEYFTQAKIEKYREFRRMVNSRWDNFYCGIVPKLINMIREKVKKNQHFKEYGPTRPMRIK